MATLLPALMSFYDALDAAAFPDATIPPIYEDTAPQVQDGVQLRPPYVVLSLAPAGDDLTFESDSVEETRVTLVAYASDQGDADATVKAVRFNGQAVAAQAGLDYCGSLPALDDGVLQVVLPVRPPAPNFAGKDKDGKNIYRTTMEWLASVQRT